jgi:simple sugar transport system permease protein
VAEICRSESEDMTLDLTTSPETTDTAPRGSGGSSGCRLWIERLFAYPSSGALLGVILVSVLFYFLADSAMFSPRGIMNWVEVSAQLTVVAVGASLLVIAGEFDLSIGSMIAFSGMVMALLIAFGGMPAWAAIIVGFAAAVGIGSLIGLIRVTTGLPSFIVSLAFLFVLRGAAIVSARLFNETTLIGGLEDYKNHDIVAFLFGGEVLTGLFRWMSDAHLLAKLPTGQPVVPGIPMIVVWALGLTAVASYVLSCSRFGNWIFATGGDTNAARSAGVPVDRVRVLLFMFSAFCATVFATTQVFDFGSADASRGLLKEFESIIAVVIGGALLSGGYGSVIGAALGALIFGIVSQGFFYTGVDGDWFQIFLGAVLLAAVAFNTYTRKRMTGGL